MRIRRIHTTATRRVATTTRGRYRRLVMIGAGTLTLVVATIGIVAAAGRSSPTAKANEPATPEAARQSPSDHKAPSSTGIPTNPSTPALTTPPLLADGTYPTYVRKVDVQAATITVDVIQVFEGDAAITAAVEDGIRRSDARYLYVYVRNQNSRLRTLPVARDVRIQFVGTCESPPDRHAALTELAEETTPLGATFYYTVTIADGVIHQIAQHLAVPAC